MIRTIEISELRLYGRHGVMDQEGKVGNDFVVTVRLRYPFGDTDDLDETINYAEIVDVVKEVMATRRQLIETVAMDLRLALLARWPLVEGGLVRVSKPAPPIPGVEMAEAAVSVEW